LRPAELSPAYYQCTNPTPSENVDTFENGDATGAADQDAFAGRYDSQSLDRSQVGGGAVADPQAEGLDAGIVAHVPDLDGAGHVGLCRPSTSDLFFSAVGKTERRRELSYGDYLRRTVHDGDADEWVEVAVQGADTLVDVWVPDLGAMVVPGAHCKCGASWVDTAARSKKFTHENER
jgi:hypothetical protein